MRNRKIGIGIILIAGLMYYGFLYYSLSESEHNEQLIITKVMSEEKEERIVEDDKDMIPHRTTTILEDSNMDDTENRNGDIGRTCIDKDDLPEGFDCIIQIPAIQLSKIVYTGKGRMEHLQQYELVTASDDMCYDNGGNYIICGHASRIYGHSLNRLRELKTGDTVVIWKHNTQRTYYISSISFENMNHTSHYCEQTESRQITIISCARYVGDNQYIVIKCK